MQWSCISYPKVEYIVADKKKNEGEEPKRHVGKLKWIILLVLLIALGSGGFFAYQHFFMSTAKTQDPATQGETAANTSADTGEGTTADGEPVPTQMFALPAFVVNLADPLGRRYLKISLEIELKDQAAVETTTKAMPKIKDGLLLLLSSKAFADLSSMEDKIVLKNEIMSRLGQILGKGKVLNVYFTDFIVQ